MNWYFQDSKGIRGPLSEAQLRKILAGKIEDTAVVRSEKSNWVTAVVAKEKFAQLEKNGIYLRSDDQIHGPFVNGKAQELATKQPNHFDSFKVGREGKWKPIEELVRNAIQLEVVPPPVVRQIPPPLPHSNYTNQEYKNPETTLLDPSVMIAPRPRTRRKSRSPIRQVLLFILPPLILWAFYFMAFHTNVLNKLSANGIGLPFPTASHVVGVDSLLFEFKLNDVEPANGTGFQLLAEAVSNTSVGDMSYAGSEEMRTRAQNKGRDIHKLEAGTKVLHLKSAVMMRRYILQNVRVLNGPLSGKEGWVLDSHLKVNL